MFLFIFNLFKLFMPLLLYENIERNVVFFFTYSIVMHYAGTRITAT